MPIEILFTIYLCSALPFSPLSSPPLCSLLFSSLFPLPSSSPHPSVVFRSVLFRSHSLPSLPYRFLFFRFLAFIFFICFSSHALTLYFLRLPYRLQSFFLKPRLISVEEYEKEGRLETARALKELREYCKSPDCNTWQIVSRLKSPKRWLDIFPEMYRYQKETYK